jgi:hypothetical protein
LCFWQLLHAKHFWVALVDAKRQECGDDHGRIAVSERNASHTAEFGRYKRLINLVDKFFTETTKSVSFMPNVWKKVIAHHVHSEVLRSPALQSSSDDDAVGLIKPPSRERMRQSTLFPTSSTNGVRVLPTKDAKNDSPTAVDSTSATKPVEPLNEIETEDLMCLVCHQNQRDGAIAHSQARLHDL